MLTRLKHLRRELLLTTSPAASTFDSESTICAGTDFLHSLPLWRSLPSACPPALNPDWLPDFTATTVAHDTHNLVVFGRDPVDMAAAANAVVEAQGGVAVSAAGRVTALLPLPIAGILSPGSAGEVAAAQRNLTEAAQAVGQFSPFLTMPLFQVMVSSLACLPGPHLTDVGLVDGTTGERISSPVLC